ncbi:hypothetical protein ACRAWD_23165 [Caulobacter segnis]
MAVGGLIGLLNGTLITRFGVAPFDSPPWAVLYVARGAALLCSNGARTFPNLTGAADYGNEGFPLLGGTASGRSGSGPDHDRPGRGRRLGRRQHPVRPSCRRVGGKRRAALLSGVRVRRIRDAGLCHLGHVRGPGRPDRRPRTSSRPIRPRARPSSSAPSPRWCWAARSLSGGRGTIGGTIIGACVIGVLGDGMVMIGVSEFWQMVIKGTVIVTAVVLDQLQGRIIGARD